MILFIVIFWAVFGAMFGGVAAGIFLGKPFMGALVGAVLMDVVWFFSFCPHAIAIRDKLGITFGWD